jgi:hypothetical protein
MQPILSLVHLPSSRLLVQYYRSGLHTLVYCIQTKTYQARPNTARFIPFTIGSAAIIVCGFDLSIQESILYFVREKRFNVIFIILSIPNITSVFSLRGGVTNYIMNNDYYHDNIYYLNRLDKKTRVSVLTAAAKKDRFILSI